jgi:hypothetical protein
MSVGKAQINQNLKIVRKCHVSMVIAAQPQTQIKKFECVSIATSDQEHKKLRNLLLLSVRSFAVFQIFSAAYKTKCGPNYPFYGTLFLFYARF